jgi:O-antigen ligase
LRFLMIVAGLACYLAVLLISTLAAGLQGAHELAVHAWAAMLCMVCVVTLAAAHRHDASLSRYLGRSVSIAATISALILIAVSFARGSLGHARLQGVLEFNWILNSNALGGVYAVCFAVAVGHGLSRHISTRERCVVFAMALLPLSIVVLTQSRGSLLGCVAALLVALFALPVRVSLAFSVLLAVLASLIGIAFPELVQLIFARADSYRFALWLHFLELSRDRPWLGHGLDFDTAYKIGHITIWTPHNILLAALVRGGILGLLSLVAALVGAVAASIAAARRGWWLPLCALTASLVLSMVDHEILPTSFNFYWYLYWLPLGLAAAAALQASKAGDEYSASASTSGHPARAMT